MAVAPYIIYISHMCSEILRAARGSENTTNNSTQDSEVRYAAGGR